MDLNELERYLTDVNPFEEEQLLTGVSVNNIPGLTNNEEDLFDRDFGYYRLPKEPFFHGNNVYIAKHNRFAPMIEHIHDFIELNYVYSGQCIQSINGNKLILKKGDFCVLDRDVPHAIEPLQTNDLLINILMNNQTFSSLFHLKLNKNDSLIGDFLIKAFDAQSQHDQYLFFETQQTPHLHTQIQLLLQEYWRQIPVDQPFVRQYLQLILSELMRLYKIEVANKQKTSFNCLDVLTYIDAHYHTVTLNEISQIFNYNKNYISNELKRATGKNFQETVLQKKLLVAKQLLLHSSQTIEEVAIHAGFHSTSYFYRQFKRFFGITPKQFRKRA